MPRCRFGGSLNNQGQPSAKLNILGLEIPIRRDVALGILVMAGIGVIWWNWDAICSRLPYCYPQCRDPAHGVERWFAAESISKDSGWVGGGSSPGQYCSGQLSTLQAARPEKKIELAGSNEAHKTEYTPFKQDYYRYTCEFRVSNPVYKRAASEHCLAKE
jgi:hypothetical protein